MDGLTLKAYEALLEDILPRLVDELKSLKEIPHQERLASDTCKDLVSEAKNLLQILSPWLGEELIKEPKQESKQELDLSPPNEEISDEEALRMLAAMNAPASGEEPVTSEAVSHKMSDEEALKMLAVMDAPTPTEAQQSNSSEMSDEEALKMLTAMDSGANLANAPTPQANEVKAPTFSQEEVSEIAEFGESEFRNDQDMLKDFLTNADELIEALDENILKLEENPHDTEIINEIFRSAHTLKGAAGMFAFNAIERIMHRMENYFDQIAKGKQQVHSDAIDVILKAMDILKALLDGARENKETGMKTVPIVTLLNQLCSGELKLNSSAIAATGQSEANTENKHENKDTGGENTAKKNVQSTIRVDVKRLDALVNLVGELVIDRTRFSSIEEQLRTKGASSQLTTNMTETVQLFGRHMNDVQDIIMKVRMVPIGNAFNKFSRIVRDLAKNLKKEINLVIEGETTELDKTIVEQIGDPLIHLIRNAVDHGIETPEIREQCDKDPKGTINLSARQEGNQILIHIQDDGKGMDKERIRAKGIEKNIITEGENLSDRDIFNLIFEPGFSTAEQVTNISGRGVGMDVVKKQISKLKGVIDINSKPGEGSIISIQLPLTVAIVQSLLVKTKGDIFAIPLSAVIESIRIKPSDVQFVGESEVIKRRNQVLPLLHLHDALELENKSDHIWYSVEGKDGYQRLNQMKKEKKAHNERLFVVVVGAAERRFGIVVDTLLNQQEMVIKSMGQIMSDVPCVAGGAILGNGEVVLVLDIAELEEHFRHKGRQHIQVA